MEDTDYTAYLKMKRTLLSQWYEGDSEGNIISFYWVASTLIAVVQNSYGDLIELIITDENGHT